MPNDERPTAPSRRSFLGAGLAAGVVVAAEGCMRVRVGETRDEAQPAPGVAPAAAPSVPSFELEGLTVEQLQQGMASGRWTARRLVELYRDRIAAVDRGGPRINQVLELNPDAIAIAEGLDAERRAGRVRGPLHGIPVLIKDNIATTDRMETTAGSLALLGARPPREAFIVARLRAAGRRATPTRSTARRRPRARARVAPRRRAWPRSRSAPRPTARSSRPRRRRVSWASSRRSAS